MTEVERLDRQAGSVAALEGAFALLVEHVSRAGALNKSAFMGDLQRLAEQPKADEVVCLAERRLLRMVAAVR
ncbi:TPA: hypothetical protein ACY17N_004676 [Pseudomonas aeruginosa]